MTDERRRSGGREAHVSAGHEASPRDPELYVAGRAAGRRRQRRLVRERAFAVVERQHGPATLPLDVHGMPRAVRHVDRTQRNLAVAAARLLTEVVP